MAFPPPPPRASPMRAPDFVEIASSLSSSYQDKLVIIVAQLERNSDYGQPVDEAPPSCSGSDPEAVDGDDAPSAPRFWTWQ